MRVKFFKLSKMCVYVYYVVLICLLCQLESNSQVLKAYNVCHLQGEAVCKE